MQHKILYNFPSRERPQKVLTCLENITTLAKHPYYQIIVTADLNDDSMCNDAMRDSIQSFPNTKVLYGTSQGKVDAINKNVGVAEPDWTILCNHSDDMVFIKEGFDLDIVEAFQDFNGLVHFPDQVAKDQLITYSMMHRDYYNQDGFIYHPDFQSVYCDNFQHNVAKARGKYKFVDKKILEHRHAIWGFGVADELLKKTEAPAVYQKDKETFQRLINEFHT